MNEKNTKPIKLKYGMCTCKNIKDCPLKTTSQYRCTKEELISSGIPVIEEKENSIPR